MSMHHVHQGLAEAPALPESVPQEAAPGAVEATQEEIAGRAYDIYLSSGRVQGQCRKNWEEARQSLQDHRCSQTQARGAEAAVPQV